VVWILAWPKIAHNTVSGVPALRSVSNRPVCGERYGAKSGHGPLPSKKLAKLRDARERRPIPGTPPMKRVAARVRMDNRTFLNHVSLH
jgi:hypothetical protein